MPKGSETKRKLHIIEVINKCYQDDIGKVQWKKKKPRILKKHLNVFWEIQRQLPGVGDM